MAKAPRYGAIRVDDDDDEPNDQSFDADQTYYLKEENDGLTSRQRLRKRLIGLVPLLAALLIMGGLAYFLYENFDRLYPGPGGGGNVPQKPQNIPATKSQTEPAATAPQTPPSYSENAYSSETSHTNNDHKEKHDSKSSNKQPSNLARECSAHVDCTGLGGDCCPTPDGIMLDCCQS